MDLRFCAAPHGLSQLYTSFIASACLGIHRVPFLSSVYTRRAAVTDALNLLVRHAGSHPAVSRMYTIYIKVTNLAICHFTHTLHVATPHPATSALIAKNHPCTAAALNALVLTYFLLTSIRQRTSSFLVVPRGIEPRSATHSLYLCCFTSSACITRSLHIPCFHTWWSQTESNRRPPACKAGALAS